MKDLIEQLIALSHFAAEHPRLVQGGGGNCSVKNKEAMAIKASGFFLEDLTATEGYAVIDRASRKPRNDSPARPSMETDFHLILGRYVIHTHPIAVGALVCAIEGKEKFRSLFPDANYLWVPYARPGQALCDAINIVLIGNDLIADEEVVLFFESHGLCVSAQNASRAQELHEATVKKLEAFFADCDISEAEIPEHKYLAPDHAVYANLSQKKELSAKQRIAIDETLYFAKKVHALISKRTWQTRWLADTEVAGLLNMDEEKYRQQLFGEQ